MIIERISAELGLPISFVEGLARGASHEYKTYDIPKRTGGKRTIHHPSRRLKALQRWLLMNVITSLPVHNGAAAYRTGQSILDNAQRHVNSRYLLRMDLENFFPSITTADLARYIADHPHLFYAWSPKDIEVFCKLVSRKGVLTIGAPTSPAISNIVCYELDTRLHEIATGSGAVYSRYADDLFFSTSKPNVLKTIEASLPEVLVSLRVPSALKMNVAKTRHSSKRGARKVTGIVLGSDGRVYVGRERKRTIRALIYSFASLNDQQRVSLAGMIAFVAGHDSQFVNKLILKYGLAPVRAAMTAPTKE